MPALLSRTVLSALVSCGLGLSDFATSYGFVNAVRQDHLRYRYAFLKNAVLSEEAPSGQSVDGALGNRLSPLFSPSFVELSTQSASEADEEEESGGSSKRSDSDNDGDDKDGDSQEKNGGEGSEKDDDGDNSQKDDDAPKGGGKKKEESDSDSESVKHEKKKGESDSDSETEKHSQESASHKEDEDHDSARNSSESATKDTTNDEKPPAEGEQKDNNVPNDQDRERIISRLTKLLSNSSGHALLGRLHDVMTEHEQAEERRAAEEAKKKEEETKKKEEAKKEAEEAKKEAEANEEKLKEETENAKKEETKKEAPVKDLLLTQQLNALWMLPFLNDEQRMATCLSGFEKLTKQSRIVCQDPACMNLERNRACAFLDVQSIDRAPQDEEEPRTIHIGFDPACKDAAQLGMKLLDLLQHPVKQHEMEQRLETVGTGAQVPTLTNHLDLVCDGKDPAAHPTCNAVSQALRNVPHLGPKNLPSMVVLADIADIPNTIGMFRIVTIFEGRVPLVDDKGNVLNKNGAKLGDTAAGKVFRNLHSLER
ncbi:hypothetical protein TGARI_258360 [Toxoplasma gondii ARI]|uniref:Rhoptry neck protein RON1 n=2 Tax=Toxoplasma gondii TaxID=5811 RepID=A0A2G8YCT1_TOXGO|nr:hypothetical protein TGARI_258360 [Toxoplasma gondii ARI]PIM05081.1 hypothetical protein TGCOUG_258360 [Toxoplasma gondii COUG]